MRVKPFVLILAMVFGIVTCKKRKGVSTAPKPHETKRGAQNEVPESVIGPDRSADQEVSGTAETPIEEPVIDVTGKIVENDEAAGADAPDPQPPTTTVSTSSGSSPPVPQTIPTVPPNPNNGVFGPNPNGGVFGPNPNPNNGVFGQNQGNSSVQCRNYNQDGLTCRAIGLNSNGQTTCRYNERWRCTNGCAEWLRRTCNDNESSSSRNCRNYNDDGLTCRDIRATRNGQTVCHYNERWRCTNGCAEWLSSSCRSNESEDAESEDCEDYNDDGLTCSAIGGQAGQTVCHWDQTWRCVNRCAKWVRDGCE